MNNSHQKQRVALWSMGASGVMSAIKITAALITGSLGVLSEALHSVIDFGATIVTVFAVRWADQPADDEHHFGHAKIESVAALLETALLFVTAIFIAYHAVMRLYEGHEPVTVQWWVIALLVVSIVVDLNRSSALKRTAKATSSEALAADAAHFQSDMWSSAAVLIGLGCVWAGIAWADSVAALCVCGVIVHIGWTLGGKTLNTLLDTAPQGLTEAVRRAALSQNGVLAVSQLRMRPAGATLFVDLGLDVPRTLPLTKATRLRANLEPFTPMPMLTSSLILCRWTVKPPLKRYLSLRRRAVLQFTICWFSNWETSSPSALILKLTARPVFWLPMKWRQL
jgi:cation diffusion facilitator family transporter